MELKVYPVPRRVRRGQEVCDLTGRQWVLIPASASPAWKARAREIVERCSHAVKRTLRVTPGRVGDDVVLAELSIDTKGLNAQGYRLLVRPEGVTLEAGDEAGALYGLQTFHQLVQQFGLVIPALRIEDHPDFPARGVMLDVSRCKVPTMTTLKLLIDRLASVRINQIQLYIEHTFAFADHETIWHDASPFTHEEIQELDAYSAERFIELVPNLNSFGHFERWLCHAEYRHLAECPDGFMAPWGIKSDHGSTLAPNQKSLDFLGRLYDEYLPNFTSSLFNAGCDETWELGKGKSRARCEKTSTTRVYVDFLKKIGRLVQKRNHAMMFWGDIILHQPELIRELPQDVIALDWGYEMDAPFHKTCRKFADARVPFYVCPGTSSWSSLTGRTQNCLGNLENAAKNGYSHGAIGYLNTDWGDGGHHQVLPVAYLGYCAGAGLSWCLKSNTGADHAAAVSRHFLDDPTGNLGRLFHELGEVMDLVHGRNVNRNCFLSFLYWDLKPESLCTQGITAGQLNRCLQTFDALERRLTTCAPDGPDRDLVIEEFRHAVASARTATRRGLAGIRREGPGKELTRDIHHLIGSHSAQWLKRNRPGGLHESSECFRSLLLLDGR